MGYCITLKKEKFKITFDNLEPCLNEILHTKNQWLKGAMLEAQKRIKYFNHLPPNIQLVELVKQLWYFSFTVDVDWNIINVDYECDKVYDMDGFCNAMAPFVESGSFLEFKGEDGKQWRYVFRDKSWKKVEPQIIWPE